MATRNANEVDRTAVESLYSVLTSETAQNLAIPAAAYVAGAHGATMALEAVNVYNTFWTDLMGEKLFGQAIMKQVMMHGMVQPLRYEHRTLTYRYVKFGCPAATACTSLEIQSQGPLVYMLTDDDVKLMDLGREAVGLGDADAAYLFTIFFTTLQAQRPFDNRGVVPCSKYGDWFQTMYGGLHVGGTNLNPFHTVPDDPYLKRYAYVVDKIYKLGVNVPPVLQGLVALHTRFLLLCTLEDMVNSFGRARTAVMQEKQDANLNPAARVIVSVFTSWVKSLASDSAVLYVAGQPAETSPFTNMATNKQIFAAYRQANDTIFQCFYENRTLHKIQDHMKTHYGVTDVFHVLDSHLLDQVKVLRDDPLAPRPDITETLPMGLAPPPSSTPSLESAVRRATAGQAPPSTDEPDAWQQLDRYTVYLFRAVMGTAVGGVAFFTWMTLQKKATWVAHPTRRADLEQSEDNWRRHKSVRNLVCLVQLARNQPLTRARMQELHQAVREEHKRLEIHRLEEATHYPLHLRHWILGLATYLILFRYSVKWAQHLYYRWKRDDAEAGDPTVPHSQQFFQSVLRFVTPFALAGTSSVAQGFMALGGVTYQLVSSSLFAKVCWGLLSALILPIVGVAGPVLWPPTTIRLLATLFSFMEHNTLYVLAALWGKLSDWSSPQVQREMKKVQQFFQDEVTLVKLKAKPDPSPGRMAGSRAQTKAVPRARTAVSFRGTKQRPNRGAKSNR